MRESSGACNCNISVCCLRHKLTLLPAIKLMIFMVIQLKHFQFFFLSHSLSCRITSRRITTSYSLKNLYKFL